MSMRHMKAFFMGREVDVVVDRGTEGLGEIMKRQNSADSQR